MSATCRDVSHVALPRDEKTCGFAVDNISFVEIDFSMFFVCLFLLSFLRFLYVFSCCLLSIMYAFCQLLSLFSIYSLSGVSRCRWWSPVEESARFVPEFDI